MEMEDASSSAEPATTATTPSKSNTTVIFMLGMAGSGTHTRNFIRKSFPVSPDDSSCIIVSSTGKTSFTQRLAAHFLAQGKKPYILNFDPACENPPFPVNIGET